jgi:hypothetical protein
MSEERATAPKQKTIVLSDGKEYVVKPLTLADGKKLLPAFNKLDELRALGKPTEELFDQMADVSYLILSRGNTGVEKEKLFDLLELTTVYTLISMCTGVE